MIFQAQSDFSYDELSELIEFQLFRYDNCSDVFLNSC